MMSSSDVLVLVTVIFVAHCVTMYGIVCKLINPSRPVLFTRVEKDKEHSDR